MLKHLPQCNGGVTKEGCASEAESLSWSDISVAFVHQKISAGIHSRGEGFDN